jgi:hypothetical protein
MLTVLKEELRRDADYNIRFKIFIYVVQGKTRVYAGYIRHDSISTKRFFVDLFPIIWGTSEPPVYCGNLSAYKRLEIYEVRSNYDDIQIYEISTRETKINDSYARGVIEKLVDSIKKHVSKIKKEKADIEAGITFLQTELQLMTRHFSRTRNLLASSEGSPLEAIFERKRTLFDRLQSEESNQVEPVHREPKFLDSIVYFSVKGEIFTILRATVLRVIPKSQLAVRVPGRLEEQAEKGDIDEEGNLIVNCHKESFKQI